MKLFLIILTSFSLPPALSGQPAEIVTYSSIPARIVHGNAELAAARYRIGEALGRLEQSGRLPNPTLDTALEHVPRTSEGRLEIGFSRKFPLTNRLALEKEIGIADVETAEAEILDITRLLIAEARTAYIEIMSIREQLALLIRRISLAGELSAFTTSASERGELSTLDAARSRLASLQLATTASSLDAREIELLGTLRLLLGIPPEVPVRLSGNLPPLAIPPTAPLRRPDLAAARSDLKAAASRINLEQARRKDDLVASVFAAASRSEDAPEGVENETMLGIRLSIPLPIWNDNHGAIMEASSRAARKESEINALATRILHESSTAIAEMRQWLALISEINEKLLPLATEQTDLLEAAYRQGQGDLQSVLDSRAQTLSLLTAKIEATRAFYLARIRYQASRGENFELPHFP